MSTVRGVGVISGVAALVLLVGVILLVGQSRSEHAKATPQTMPTTQSGKVVATVNGEPIYESELLAGLPDDTFEAKLEEMKKAKLERLVEETIQAQFLKDRKITVSEDELSQATKEFEEMVKTPGCPCCGGGYASLDQFMKVNAFSAAEVRRRISSDAGLKIYMERLTKERTAPSAVAEAAKKNQTQIEADYAQGYAILFPYLRDPSYISDAKTVEAKKEKLANDALGRLKKGDAFETVAKEMSEDPASAAKGGALGCIRTDFLGPEMAQVFRKLEPGTHSDVVKARWGCGIVMRKPLSEADILTVAKEQAKNLVEDQVYQEFNATRDRAKIQYGSLSASAPAAVPANSPSEKVTTDQASQ